jgi:hypothetical protein
METLHMQFKKSRHLRRRIMRRVWYAYMLSTLLRPALVMGFVFGVSIIAFWRLVSITSIVTNLLNVKLGALPTYVFGALIQADTLALIAFIGLTVGALFMVVKLGATLRMQYLATRMG